MLPSELYKKDGFINWIIPNKIKNKMIDMRIVFFWIKAEYIYIFIDKYITIWSDKAHDYIDDNFINTGKPEIVLNELDILLIKEYLDDKIQNSADFASYNSLHKKRFIIKTIYNIIEACNKIELNSLLKKLYIYIADIIWNCSIIDVETFEKEQWVLRIWKRTMDN